MIDFHLSDVYGVETKALNQAVKRNEMRFPEDFMFHLTGGEWEALKNEIATLDFGGTKNQRSQIVTSKPASEKRLRSQDSTSNPALIKWRQNISNYDDLSARINALEKQTNRKFKDIHEALDYLMSSRPATEIGFRQASRTPGE